MPFARILERDRDNLLMIAAIAPASQAGPRIRALYPMAKDQNWPEQRLNGFFSARALVARGMRLMGHEPVAVSPGGSAAPDWGRHFDGSISYGPSHVAVWLSCDTTHGHGLHLFRIGDATDAVTRAERHILTLLPGLQRLTMEERLAAAVSAKRALAKALAPRIESQAGRHCATVVGAAQSGITLSLTDDLATDLRRGSRFRVDLRVYPGLVLTRISVPAPAAIRP